MDGGDQSFRMAAVFENIYKVLGGKIVAGIKRNTRTDKRNAVLDFVGVVADKRDERKQYAAVFVFIFDSSFRQGSPENGFVQRRQTAV